jgi:hypothetical protein
MDLTRLYISQHFVGTDLKEYSYIVSSIRCHYLTALLAKGGTAHCSHSDSFDLVRLDSDLGPACRAGIGVPINNRTEEAVSQFIGFH